MHSEIRKYFEHGVDRYSGFRVILGKDETNITDTMIGALGGNRTHDPRLRRPILYPTELRAHKNGVRYYQHHA